MIQTHVYYPTNPEKFRENLKELVVHNNLEMPKEIVHYNSNESMSKRTDGVLIYHILDATVFVHDVEEYKGRVNITATVRSIPGEVEAARSLLEKMTKIKLMKRL